MRQGERQRKERAITARNLATITRERAQRHNAKPETEASRDTCRQSHSRHPRHTADTSDVPWAGTRTPGRSACHCHPQAMSPAGSGTTGRTETALAKLLARPQPQVMGDGKRTQSTKDCTSHPQPQVHAAAPGQVGHCHPVPALGDTTAAAPAAPAPPLGAQLRPRLPQAEVLRQLPERSHGPRHLRACARLQPWAPVPPRAHACYALATPRAPSVAGAAKESCGSGREHEAGGVRPGATCWTIHGVLHGEPLSFEVRMPCLPEPFTGTRLHNSSSGRHAYLL